MTCQILVYITYKSKMTHFQHTNRNKMLKSTIVENSAVDIKTRKYWKTEANAMNDIISLFVVTLPLNF